MHFVDEGVDTGPILLQRAVEVMEGDNEETLSARILEQEHRLYWRAIALVLERMEEGASAKAFSSRRMPENPRPDCARQRCRWLRRTRRNSWSCTSRKDEEHYGHAKVLE